MNTYYWLVAAFLVVFVILLGKIDSMKNLMNGQNVELRKRQDRINSLSTAYQGLEAINERLNAQYNSISTQLQQKKESKKYWAEKEQKIQNYIPQNMELLYCLKKKSPVMDKQRTCLLFFPESFTINIKITLFFLKSVFHRL